MAVFLDQDGLVAALEQVAGPSVPIVEELGVNAVQLPHADGEVAVRGLDENMGMVGHEAVGMADPIVAFVDVLEGVQKVQTVSVIFENGLFLVAARCNMVDCAGVFDTEGTRHKRRISKNKANVKPQDLTLWVLTLWVHDPMGSLWVPSDPTVLLWLNLQTLA